MSNTAARLAWIVERLRTVLGAFMAAQSRAPQLVWIGAQPYLPIASPEALPKLSTETWRFFWNRLGRLANRFQILFDRWHTGRLPARRAARPAQQAHPVKRRLTPLPRAHGWANRRIPKSAPCAGQLHALLTAPETAAFVAAAPQAGRLLRPLCHALGVALPPWLSLPLRPRPPRAKPAPSRPPETGPLPPQRKPPPYVLAAARVWKRNEG